MPSIDPDTLKANLAEARQKRDEALAAYERAKAEIAWLLDGLKMFDPQAAEEFQLEDATGDPNAVVTELFPDPTVFEDGDTKPTLRQAILLVMHAHPTLTWGVRDLVMALDQRGWLPENEPTKRVSDIAGVMTNARQLVRVDRGLYTLAPHVSVALDGVFHRLGSEECGLAEPGTDLRLPVSKPAPQR